MSKNNIVKQNSRTKTKEEKNDHRSIFTKLTIGRKKPGKNQGFNVRDTGVMLYQLSYEATH